MPALCLLLALTLAAPAAAQWAPAASMGTPRGDAAFAVLDGRLVVAGGRGAGGVLLASVEAYDPATDTWTALAPLPEARVGAAATVHDGTLYVLGGSDSEGAADEVFLYDATDDEWSEDDRSMDRDRDRPATASLGGTLYVLGGADEEDGFRATAEQREPDDWETYEPWTLNPARARMAFATVGGALVVAGGVGQFGPVANVERFVPGAGAEALPALPTPRGGAALATDGTALVVVGGRDATDATLASVLELGAGGWTERNPLPDARQGSAVAIFGRTLVVAGGVDRFGGAMGSAVRYANFVADEVGPTLPGLVLAHAGAHPTAAAVRAALTLDAPTALRATVVDLLGREVAVLADGVLGAGRHALAWTGAAPGLYLVRVQTDAGQALLRATVVR